MINYTPVHPDEDLRGVLVLQAKKLSAVLSEIAG